MTITTKNYSVDLDIFQGPMDLLLYLINRDEIDIYDIPVARITEQYLKYVEVLKLLNLENAGEYILMAATLIRIKARMLLPRESGEDEEGDPREELTRALLEYRKFKEAGDILREQRENEAHVHPVRALDGVETGTHKVLAEESTLYDLLTAFHDVMTNLENHDAYLVNYQEINIEDRMAVIRRILTEREWATFGDFFADARRKIVAIVTFLAILDMVKHNRLRVRQSVSFAEIRIYRTELLHTDWDVAAEESSQEAYTEEVTVDV